MSSTIGNSNEDVGPNNILDLDDTMSIKIYMIWATCGGDKDDNNDSTTELETHVNIAVVGSQATVFHTDRTAKLISFSDEVDKLESAPIIDAALSYECHKTLKTYLLIVKNYFHIPSMQHNLITPFIMREAGLEVNYVPRIHIRYEVTHESHSIMIPKFDLSIPMRISGVLSYFESRSLTDKDIEECETTDTVLVTPDSKVWDPHCDSYAEQEEKFLYFR